MKVTKTEKVILGAMAVIVLFIGISVTYTVKAINEAGGIKTIIIEAGKEIKDIGEQINKDS